MTALVDDLVPDELWALLPTPPRPPYGGRHRAIPDRACFAFVLVACALTCFNRL